MKRTFTIALVGLSTIGLFGCSASFDKSSYLDTYNKNVTDAVNDTATFEKAMSGANTDVASQTLGALNSDMLSLTKLGQTPNIPQNVLDNLNSTLDHLNTLQTRAGILDGFITSDQSAIQNVPAGTLTPIEATLDQMTNQLKTDQSAAQQLLK